MAAQAAVPDEADITAIMNFKGGVGKTFLLQLLLAALAKRQRNGKPRRLLAVDLDPQANLTRRLGIAAADMAARLSVAEVFRDIDTNPDLIKQAILPCQWEEDFADNIDVLPSRIELGRFAEGGAGSWLRLRRALTVVAGDYTDILIDTPPGLAGLGQNALCAGGRRGRVLFVTWPETDSINGVRKIINFMNNPNEGKAIGAASEVMGVVTNFRHHNAKTHKTRAEEVVNVWGPLAWQPNVPQTIRIQESASEFAEPPQKAGGDIVSVAEALGDRYVKAVA